MKIEDVAYYVSNKVKVGCLTPETYVGIDNILPNRGGVIPSAYLPDEGEVTEFRKGDVLVGNIRPYFKKVWLATFDGGCSPDVLCLRSKGNISSEFLYCILSQDSFFEYVTKGAKGSKMPRGDKDHILEFVVEDIADKDRVGSLIVSINNKIKVNNEISTRLQSLARLIYDYWFVQFDFPDKNGRPYKSSGGKMVWCDELKHEIPDGWGVERLSDLVNIKINQVSPKDAKNLPYTPMDMLPVKRMTFGSFRSDEEANSSLLAYQKNDILFGAMRPYFHRVCLAPFNGITRTTTFVLRSSSEILGYAFETIDMDRTVAYATAHSVGTQQPYAIWENGLADMLIAKPPVDLKKEYSQRINAVIEMQYRVNLENARLSLLRDFFHPLLMNGQVVFR